MLFTNTLTRTKLGLASLAAAVAVIGASIVAAPASADGWRRDDCHRPVYRHRHYDHHYYYRPAPRYYAPPCDYYYRPAPRYYYYDGGGCSTGWGVSFRF